MAEEQTFDAPRAEAPANEGGFNLRDALEHSMNEIDARNEAEARPRDDAGRFTKRNEDTVSEEGLTNAGEPPKAEAETQPETETEAAQEPSEAEEAETAPKAGDDNPIGWKAEEKAVFDALPEEVQQMVADRFKQVQGMATRKAQEVGQFGQIGQMLHENVYAPRLQAMQAQGINPVQRTAELFAYADAMQANPVQTMQRLMQETGVTVQQLAQAAGVSLAAADSWDYEPQQPDPLSTIDQRLEEKLAPLIQRLEAQDAQAVQAQQATLVSEIDTFKSATGADGAPLYPHFDDVFDDMLVSMQAVTARRPDLSPRQKLEQAYAMAVAANPAVAERVNRANRAKIALEEDAKARKAKGNVRNIESRGTPANIKQSTKGPTMRDTMASVYDELNG